MKSVRHTFGRLGPRLIDANWESRRLRDAKMWGVSLARELASSLARRAPLPTKAGCWGEGGGRGEGGKGGGY